MKAKHMTKEHKANTEKALKALSERTLPLDLKRVQEEILRNSADTK